VDSASYEKQLPAGGPIVMGWPAYRRAEFNCQVFLFMRLLVFSPKRKKECRIFLIAYRVSTVWKCTKWGKHCGTKSIEPTLVSDRPY